MGFTNFPVQLTSFIGREREIADIKRLLSSSHLVTLTGAGGFTLSFDGVLKRAAGGLVQNGSVYTSSGRGPTLRITVSMGMGTLNLKTE